MLNRRQLKAAGGAVGPPLVFLPSRDIHATPKPTYTTQPFLKVVFNLLIHEGSVATISKKIY